MIVCCCSFAFSTLFTIIFILFLLEIIHCIWKMDENQWFFFIHPKTKPMKAHILVRMNGKQIYARIKTKRMSDSTFFFFSFTQNEVKGKKRFKLRGRSGGREKKTKKKRDVRNVNGSFSLFRKLNRNQRQEKYTHYRVEIQNTGKEREKQKKMSRIH